MILEVGLVQFLNSVPAITAITAARIFGLVRSQASDLPALLIQRTGTVRQVKFCGTDKLVSSDIQIDSYAATGHDAWALAAAVRGVMVDYVGNMGTVYVDQATLTNEFPLIDPDPGVIRVTQLYNIWYQED